MVHKGAKSENQRCFAFRAPVPSSKAQPKNIHPWRTSLSISPTPAAPLAPGVRPRGHCSSSKDPKAANAGGAPVRLGREEFPKLCWSEGVEDRKN